MRANARHVLKASGVFDITLEAWVVLLGRCIDLLSPAAAKKSKIFRVCFLGWGIQFVALFYVAAVSAVFLLHTLMHWTGIVLQRQENRQER